MLGPFKASRAGAAPGVVGGVPLLREGAITGAGAELPPPHAVSAAAPINVNKTDLRCAEIEGVSRGLSSSLLGGFDMVFSSLLWLFRSG
jgi:hypothetical protein